TKLKDRYKELRGSFFSYSSLMERFRKYNDLFDKSGAASRERKRWNMEDNSTEINYLSTWITDRLSYLDNQYLGGQYVGNAVIDVSASKIKFAPNPVRDVLTVFNLTAGEKVQVISLQGDILIQTQSNGGNVVVNMSGLASGVYLIKAGQEVSKLIKK
ncbi:MAG: T9SS type A sorting domain-containing protein, partial [Parabacteroides sp.]|nr:T9SS type A sorting domain-containing protein [Parabacteroides sp.]